MEKERTERINTAKQSIRKTEDTTTMIGFKEEEPTQEDNREQSEATSWETQNCTF